MPKVTVIMPSLNVEKYIRFCLDSVLAQTLKDIEILAIDAGSDDGTLDILQEYAALDKRIRVIHSDRKSYGYQLNMGIALARGEYVGVVETDDKIENDMFQTLYECAMETGADYVKGCAQAFMEVTSAISLSGRIICTSLMEKPINPKDYPELFVTDRFLWLGIYRNDFIKKIKLNETSGAAFQDIGFLFQAISNAERAVYLDKDVYFYRQDNVEASSYDIKGFRYLVEEYRYVRKFFREKGSEWYQAYYRKMMEQCMGRFRVMAASGCFWKESVLDIESLRESLTQAVKEGFLIPEKLDEITRERLYLLLNGSKNIYTYFANEIEKKSVPVRKLLKVVRNYQVVVFGCGAIGKFTHALLEKWHSGFSVAYCDNNVELWNTEIQGIAVLSPKEAVYRYPDAVYVVTGRKNAETMWQQLNSLGVEDKNIFVFQERTDIMLLQRNNFTEYER